MAPVKKKLRNDFKPSTSKSTANSEENVSPKRQAKNKVKPGAMLEEDSSGDDFEPTPPLPKVVKKSPPTPAKQEMKQSSSNSSKPSKKVSKKSKTMESGEDQPFCCKSIRPQIDQEAIFNQFMEKKGTVKNHNYSDGFVFEVKRKKIKNKRWLSRLFVLEDGIREETPNFDPDCISWLSKITVLKTDCEFHKLSFELNLYEIDDWTMKDDYSWRDENLDEDEEGPEWVQNPQFC